MRVIVIDAEKQEIREETINPKETLGELQRIVSGLIDTAFRLGNHDCYVDDEGLFKQPKTGFYFSEFGAFAGNGVIVSHDKSGNTCAATLPVDLFQKSVHWIDLRDAEHA